MPHVSQTIYFDQREIRLTNIHKANVSYTIVHMSNILDFSYLTSINTSSFSCAQKLSTYFSKLETTLF